MFISLATEIILLRVAFMFHHDPQNPNHDFYGHDASKYGFRLNEWLWILGPP